MAEDQQVEKFDPSKLMQGVKDRIKATFVSLIPDDQWDGVVQKEIDAFFNEPVQFSMKEHKEDSDNYWSRTFKLPETPMPVFRTIVWNLCYDHVIAILKERYNKEFFSDKWNSELGTYDLSDKMKDIIAEAAPAAFANILVSISSSVVRDAMNSLNRGY